MKTYKQLQERINMAKAKMGDVIKDFQDSDAPQFKGKSDEKRRQMAIAAKLSNEEVEELEELSKATLGSYVKKAIPDAEHKEYWGRADRPTKGQRQYLKSAKNRRQGINKAIDKLTKEELEGDQHKIDANKNGKVDGHDFKLLRGKKK